MPPVQTRHLGLLTRMRNFERMREIAAVATRHGFDYVLERHYLWSLLPRFRRSRRRQPPAPTQRGRHIREMLEELGPTFVKFGQLLATRPDVIPADIIEELVKLQDQVAPMPFTVVQEVVEAQLGLSLARLFEDFDPTPLAAASIGQVHAATLPGGEKVVVKVQRPEAPLQIRKDIELLYQFAQLVESHWETSVSPSGLVDEFARSINRELDYGLEARNIVRFALNFSDSETVLIPRVYERYSTSRVLTMQRVMGPTLNSPEVAALPVPERKALAETIASCWLKQILKDGFVHGDPHPANIVYLGSGRIALLDFGMAGSLRHDDLEEGARLFLRVMESDVEGIKRSLRRLGVGWAPSLDEAVTQTIEETLGRYFGAPLRELDARVLVRQVFQVIYSLRLRLPARFLLLDRAVVTLEGVTAQLYPDLNLFDLARDYAEELRLSLSDPRHTVARTQKALAEYAQVLRDYPFQVHELLEALRMGELEMRYRHTGLEDVTHRLDVIANRLVVALVSIALGATGTAVAILVDEGPHIGGLSVWGLPGFVGSLFFGAWLIYAIIRSGRL